MQETRKVLERREEESVDGIVEVKARCSRQKGAGARGKNGILAHQEHFQGRRGEVVKRDIAAVEDDTPSRTVPWTTNELLVREIRSRMTECLRFHVKRPCFHVSTTISPKISNISSLLTLLETRLSKFSSIVLLSETRTFSPLLNADHGKRAYLLARPSLLNIHQQSPRP